MVGLEESLSMHAGYWDATTKTLREALVKENQIMAEIARITTAIKFSMPVVDLAAALFI